MPAFRTLRVLAATLPAVLAVVLLPADGARAADRTVAGGRTVADSHTVAGDRTVSGGRLDWGVKASFQHYVTGPVAEGGWTLAGGAGTVGDSQFRFHSATGSYDPADGALRAGFSGEVRFTGHAKPDGTKELDLTIGNPTVSISAGGSGALHADLRGKAKGSGKVTVGTQVRLASLDLSGVDMRGGGTPVTLTNVPATLTAEGAKSFAGYYPAGTALDPVSLSADVRPPGAGGPSSGGDGGDGGGKDEDKGKGKGKDGGSSAPEPVADRGKFADAALDWGVRRTFREYVTGPVAKGRWQLSDGARDAGAAFRFPSGKGRYDLRKGELDAELGGTVRFTGKQLDTVLHDVTVRVRDGRGTLSAQGTPLVTFPVKPLKPAKGLLRVTEARAELTAEGSEFFGGMYRKGTSMAPVSLAVALVKGAELPAPPDLGSAAAAPSPSSSATDGSSAAAEDTANGSGPAASGIALPVTLTVASLGVLGGVFWYLRRHRPRRTAAADGPATATPTATAPATPTDSKEQDPR